MTYFKLVEVTENGVAPCGATYSESMYFVFSGAGTLKRRSSESNLRVGDKVLCVTSELLNRSEFDLDYMLANLTSFNLHADMIARIKNYKLSENYVYQGSVKTRSAGVVTTHTKTPYVIETVLTYDDLRTPLEEFRREKLKSDPEYKKYLELRDKFKDIEGEL